MRDDVDDLPPSATRRVRRQRRLTSNSAVRIRGKRGQILRLDYETLCQVFRPTCVQVSKRAGAVMLEVWESERVGFEPDTTL
jgi:hypothetical protein